MADWIPPRDKCRASTLAGAIAGYIAGAGAGAGIASAIPVGDDRKFWLVVGLSIAGAVVGVLSGLFGGMVAGGCYDHPDGGPKWRFTRSSSRKREGAPGSTQPKSGEATW